MAKQLSRRKASLLTPAQRWRAMAPEFRVQYVLSSAGRPLASSELARAVDALDQGSLVQLLGALMGMLQREEVVTDGVSWAIHPGWVERHRQACLAWLDKYREGAL